MKEDAFFPICEIESCPKNHWYVSSWWFTQIEHSCKILAKSVKPVTHNITKFDSKNARVLPITLYHTTIAILLFTIRLTIIMKNTINIRTFASRLFILASAFALTFCGDDDDKNAPQFSFTIDGVAQEVQITSGILRSEIQHDHEGRALNITAVVKNNKTLSVAVSNWDFQNPPANGVLTGEYDATWDFENTEEENPFANCLSLEGGVTLCDGGLVSLISEGNFYTSVFDGPTDATITISKCDASKRTVSGSFTAKIAGFDGVHQYTVTGNFENLAYIVQ